MARPRNSKSKINKTRRKKNKMKTRGGFSLFGESKTKANTNEGVNPPPNRPPNIAVNRTANQGVGPANTVSNKATNAPKTSLWDMIFGPKSK